MNACVHEYNYKVTNLATKCAGIYTVALAECIKLSVRAWTTANFCMHLAET